MVVARNIAVVASRRSRRSNLLILASLFAAACSPQEPPPPSDPVVVYAAFEDASHLVDVFDRYKEETGVLVIVRRGPAGKIVDDLIENDISPPADLLITNSVVPAWRAAEEGALRPLYSDVLRERIPDWARDADDLWFGIGIQPAVIVHNMPGLDLSGVADFTALAEQRFAGSLCMTSSSMSANRAVMAMMISEHGVRPTELVVRDWVKNLAVAPFDSEEQLLDALSAGTCGIAITSNSAAAGSGLEFRVPETMVADIDTLGVARHARNPDGAVALAEWLISEIEYPQIGRAPASQKNASAIAMHYEDAIKLAERARYH